MSSIKLRLPPHRRTNSGGGAASRIAAGNDHMSLDLFRNDIRGKENTLYRRVQESDTLRNGHSEGRPCLVMPKAIFQMDIRMCQAIMMQVRVTIHEKPTILYVLHACSSSTSLPLVYASSRLPIPSLTFTCQFCSSCFCQTLLPSTKPTANTHVTAPFILHRTANHQLKTPTIFRYLISTFGCMIWQPLPLFQMRYI